MYHEPNSETNELSHSPQLWTDEICFYLDGVSFWHKTNPVAEAKTPRGKIWRQRNEGLNPLCTAKGSHTCSGGKVVKMFVAISYGKGVIFCEQYEKCDGDYFLNFIRRNFRKLFRASGKTHSRPVETICSTGAPNDNFRENICSEDDLRSRIFGTFVVKFLACLPLLGFSNI